MKFRERCDREATNSPFRYETLLRYIEQLDNNDDSEPKFVTQSNGREGIRIRKVSQYTNTYCEASN